jgi:hypothetical protein
MVSGFPAQGSCFSLVTLLTPAVSLKDPSAPQSANDFEETLCDFLTSMQLPQHATKLRAFDFSPAKVVLISSYALLVSFSRTLLNYVFALAA